jgi:glycerol-3-phosphate cytidylyltransferase
MSEMKKYKVGVIAGNFDVIHPGYIQMFNDCKLNCEHLIIFLHDDPSIERPEKLKPILTLEERVSVLSSLRQIDEIISYNTEAELYELFKKNLSRIEVRFLGEDYKEKKFTGDDLNIPIHWLGRGHGWSTTKFKKLISETVKKS